MILIDEILVSRELVTLKFTCNLNACKGACCYEGDYGAPLEDDELVEIENVYPKIKKYLDKASIKQIENKGLHGTYAKEKFIGTPLMDDGSCAFLFYENGITHCAFERAYTMKEIDFKKPISCHLYPVRVEKNKATGFEALNYDEWDICKPACVKGSKLGISVYEFSKEAIIRKYGVEFYDRLDHIASEDINI